MQFFVRAPIAWIQISQLNSIQFQFLYVANLRFFFFSGVYIEFWIILVGNISPLGHLKRKIGFLLKYVQMFTNIDKTSQSNIFLANLSFTNWLKRWCVLRVMWWEKKSVKCIPSVKNMLWGKSFSATHPFLYALVFSCFEGAI